MSKEVTGQQLRAEIDGGRTGDKVAFADPATVPLETDAEAGGASVPFKSEVRIVHNNSSSGWAGLWIYIAAALGIAAAALLIVGLAA